MCVRAPRALRALLEIHDSLSDDEKKKEKKEKRKKKKRNVLQEESRQKGKTEGRKGIDKQTALVCTDGLLVDVEAKTTSVPLLSSEPPFLGE